MDYDEIDQYVDQLFNQPGKPDSGDDGQPLNGEVLSGDWRIDRIDQIIQDAYDEAIWWHNNRISEGADPRSGLRNLPYIPWDERIDGVAAMMGAIGGPSESSYQRNGDPRDNHPAKRTVIDAETTEPETTEPETTEPLQMSLAGFLAIVAGVLFGGFLLALVVRIIDARMAGLL